MNEGKEKKSIFFAFSLIMHFLLIIILLSLPARVNDSKKADYSRRVFIDFDIPAPSGLKSSSKIKGKGKRAKKSISKKSIPASFSSTKEKRNIKSKEKGKIPLVTDGLNTKQSEIPVKFSLNGKNKKEIFGIQNIAFSGTGYPDILSPSGNGNGGGVSGLGRRNGKGINGNSFSGSGNSENFHYTNYYELCFQKIEEQKKYPDIAVVRQIEGKVDVKITLNPTGEITAINILKSSGWDMLDEEAARCVRRASPFPSPPEEMLSDSKLILSFTIVFELN